MKPGVYFNLPEADYFAADALGSSDLKLLARSPADWWFYSRHNVLRPIEQDGDGKRFGSALHKFLLEGVAAYDATYYTPPIPPAEALRTMEDIRAAMAARGIAAKSSASKGELTAALKAKDPSAVFLDEWRSAMDALHAGREELSERWDYSIRVMGRVVANHPELKTAFNGGAPEVSVFWEDRGVTFRARFDYKKPAGLFDLKTIANWKGDDFRKACLREIASRQYDAQAAHYIDAHEQARNLIDAGQVHGMDPAAAKALFAGDYLFVFVFMQTMGSPRALPIVFPQGNAVHERGKQSNDKAIDSFIQYRDAYGLKSMWLEIDRLWQPDLEEWAHAAFWRN